MKKVEVNLVTKKSFFWFIAALFSAITFLVVLYSPFRGEISPKDRVKKVYYVDSMSEAQLKIIREFNELNKGKIEVVPKNLPLNEFTTDDRKEILTSALRSRNSGIDIFSVDMIWVPRFAKWAYTLNHDFSERTLKEVDTLALRPCYVGDSLVAFPLIFDEGVMYYRKDLIGTLPRGRELEREIQKGLTWHQFISISRLYQSTRTSRGDTLDPVFVFPGAEYEGMLCCFHEMLDNKESDRIFYPQTQMSSTGSDVLPEKFEINLDTYPAARALQLLVNFIYHYNFSPPEVTQFNEYTSYLYALDHNALFLKGWEGYPKQYHNYFSADEAAKVPAIGVAPLPHFIGDATSSVFGGWDLMISKFSKRKKEALKFIKFIFQKKNQEILWNEGGYLPVNDSVYHDGKYMRRHKGLVKVYDMLKWGRYRPFLQDYTRLSEIMAKYFHRALMHEISVKDALVQASRQINDGYPVVN